MNLERFTVAASMDGLRSRLVAARNAGQRVVAGFELPTSPWDVHEARIVCVGEIADESTAETALLAAVRGAELVVHLSPELTIADRFLDDLSRLGPLTFDAESHAPLTHEERRLLTSIANGESMEAAARAAHVSRRTIERRIAGARKKLGVSTTVEAVLAASRRGLLDGDVAV